MNTTFDSLIDDADYADESQVKVWLKRCAIALLVVVIIGAIGYGFSKLMSGGSPQKKQITTIKLLPDTPPPPPPPPKEPPKEQVKEQPKEIKVEQPKPAEAPPAEQLKMEGPAGDGPSAFQAGAVSNDYKGGDVKTIGSDGGAKFTQYKSSLTNHVIDFLEKDKNLKKGNYKMILRIWLKPNGGIERVQVTDSTATPEVEQAVKAALENMPFMNEAPPENLPQPTRMDFGARGIG